ncbi:hypothetical protein SM124_11725 [Bacillus sp. 31A1R]|uniref:Lipoprotein n=1 Tax=Robertmurraya mangrovi TaxID=3098077 RepID=A0ABU5IZ94_9BACI|nr:hypothetical protein [Bacillus sp. 31A1R]MDZ5472417.1 hypothetical protein [Bacillus sp. 31A1R]
MKLFLVLAISIFMVLTGCSSEPGNTDKNIIPEEAAGSYVALLRINGAEYLSVGKDNQGEYTIGKEIGKVEKRVPPEVMPRVDFVSNYLDEGTLIFSVKENNDVILVETKVQGVYEIFERLKRD